MRGVVCTVGEYLSGAPAPEGSDPTFKVVPETKVMDPRPTGEIKISLKSPLVLVLVIEGVGRVEQSSRRTKVFRHGEETLRAPNPEIRNPSRPEGPDVALEKGNQRTRSLPTHGLR